MKSEDIKHIVVAIIAIVALILAVLSLFAIEVDDGDEDVGTENGSNMTPTAVIECTAITVEIGSYVGFNGSGSTDPDGTIIEYTWDFDQGIKDSGIYSNHFYSSAGTYSVKLTVVDNKGASDVESIIITVIDGDGIPQNDPPVAEINVNTTTVEAGFYISFNGSESTDTDGTIVEYTWDFGDGTKDSGMYSCHIYQTKGIYNVTLTVVDDYGSIDDTNITITVDQEPTETTPKGSLYFSEDPDISGKYYGQFQGIVQEDKIEISILDSNINTTVIMRPNEETFVQIPGGLNMTYTDANSNDNLDGADILLIQGGSYGDKVTIVYKPTGEAIVTHTLT